MISLRITSVPIGTICVPHSGQTLSSSESVSTATCLVGMSLNCSFSVGFFLRDFFSCGTISGSMSSTGFSSSAMSSKRFSCPSTPDFPCSLEEPKSLRRNHASSALRLSFSACCFAIVSFRALIVLFSCEIISFSSMS